MRTLYSLCFLLFLSVLSFQCQKEISFTGDHIPGGDLITSSPVTATLQGNVVDESGQPAAGVLIKQGSKTALTDARGYFRIREAALDKNASLVTAEKPGYFKAFRSFRASVGVNQVNIQLMKKELAGSVSSTAGGAVTFSNGASVALPPNGIVKAAGGGSYSGNVLVYTAYIDPTEHDIASTVPGSFMANDKDNNRVTLASYGMLAVELESASGEKLQIASGKVATLITPIPASIQSSAPATISLWYLDEQTGIWKEEGKASKTGTTYTGEVKHFSYWNCDIGLPTIAFTASFKTSTGLPLTYAHVQVRTASGYNGTAHGITDSLGQVNGLIPSGVNLVLEVIGDCGVVYTKAIGPFTNNTDLGTLTIPATSTAIVTVNGRVVNCSNNPVTDGYVMIYYDNTLRYAPLNAQGEYGAVFVSCTTAPANFEVLAVDEATNVQGQLLTLPVNSPVTDAGSIQACGISTLQYINYTIDGIDYNLSESSNDSLFYGYTFPVAANPNNFHTLLGVVGNTTGQIELVFESVTETAGSWPLQYARTDLFQRTKMIAPVNVNLTNFPVAVHQFYEGNFSGQFRDSADLSSIHTISCTFRVKK